jgi:hypothetical protein
MKSSAWVLVLQKDSYMHIVGTPDYRMESIMPAFSGPVTPASLCPGTVVFVWIFPWIRHKGIVSDRFSGGKPMVISNSARAGGVAEEQWDDFAGHQPIYVEGYPSKLPGWTVVQRARACVGAKYDVFRWNCEHLTTHAHGLTPRSPQIAWLVGTALAAGMLVVAIN